MRDTIIKFLRRIEREDHLGETWTFEAGELEDHVSQIDEYGNVQLNFG